MKKELTLRRLSAPGGGFEIFAAEPAAGSPVRGGLVLIQEIFGLNAHIRSLAERYAERGYRVYAPALFDRVEKGVEVGYDLHGMAKGRAMIGKISHAAALTDIELTAQALAATFQDQTPETAPIAAIGFCWGGTLAWLAACRLEKYFRASIAYYGRQAYEYRLERPKIPLMMHYGAKDAAIPLEQVDEMKRTHPSVPIFVYDAGHGFNCDARHDYDPKAAAEAEERTFAFLGEHGL